MAADTRNFDQKIFMFPDSYNELRKELVNNWPELWKDPRCGWAMAFDAPMFTEFMNSKLDGVLKIVTVGGAIWDDKDNCNRVCHIFLTELRKRRGEVNP